MNKIKMINNATSNPKNLWRKIDEDLDIPTLNNDLETEVCIIGAGIAGLSTAYQLLQQGKKVVVLEAKNVAQGESGNTSAHLSNALDDRYFNIEKMHGLAKAKLAAQSHSKAIDWIESIIKKENIECDFARISGFLFSPGNEKILAKEYAAARRAGIKVTYETEQHVGKTVKFPAQARFHPEKYLHGLAKVILNLGGKIYQQAAATKIDFEKNHITVNNKYTIITEKIVTATNAPLFGNLKMHSRLNPQRTYIIVLKIAKNSIKDALFWDTAEPYHYVRLYTQDEKFDLLIVGGADHRVGVQPKKDPFKQLMQWTIQQFHLETAPIIYQWSGQVLEPVDYMAYIGPHPKSKNAFIVTGDSGNGLTHGTIAGLLIADLIMGKANPYAALYNPQRKLPLRAIPEWLKNIFASMLGYIKYLIPQWHRMPEVGTGKIVQRGFKKIAVYHESPHNFKKCSAVCSHLRAVVQWNPVENSWDCPAHGSRFDLDGKFINGPANQNLKCPFKK